MAVESRKGVTAHGSPIGPLQFDRLGSYPGRQNFNLEKSRKGEPQSSAL